MSTTFTNSTYTTQRIFTLLVTSAIYGLLLLGMNQLWDDTFASPTRIIIQALLFGTFFSFVTNPSQRMTLNENNLSFSQTYLFFIKSSDTIVPYSEIHHVQNLSVGSPSFLIRLLGPMISLAVHFNNPSSKKKDDIIRLQNFSSSDVATIENFINQKRLA